MTGTLQRSELIADILDDRPEDLLVVTGLGSSTYDVLELGDNPNNFYMWGAMGQSAVSYTHLTLPTILRV